MKKDEGVSLKTISAAQVCKICDEIQKVENLRALDRALINNLFNGGRPYTTDEAEKFQIQVNVNWQEGNKLLQDANRQINNALIFKERLFTATSRGGKPEKRDDYSQTFTRLIHDPLKFGRTGRRHAFLLRSRNAAAALHGIGPIMWLNTFRWLGRFIPLEDLLIPTDTLIDFSNLSMFAVNLYLTQAEFFDMAHGDKVDKGWDVKIVEKILDDLSDPSQMQGSNQTLTFQEQPEKRVEQFKQNRCFLDSDAVKTVKLRMFFFKHPKKGDWYRCAVLRENTPSVDATKDFIYDGRSEPYCDGIEKILHVQFGDNSLCAPLKWPSVRGLGVMLYSPVECNNRVRCETVQHLLLNLKTLLRVSNPPDRDRPKMLDLSQYSVVEDGVSIIPNTERHQIDPRLVEYVQSQMRQLMSESSASFVQDINDGSSKEMTATETNARVQSVNVQVSAMLQSMYSQEMYYYEEIVRRFLDKNSDDDDVEDFQSKCIAAGIPKALMVASNWKISPERVLGAGDQFIAGQEANSLLGQSQRFDPNSQRIILKKWVTTITRDPAMAELLVPSDQNQATPGTIAAEDVFGTLMNGISASIREGIDRTSYVEALLGLMASKIQQIASIDAMGTPHELIGLKTTGDHIGKNIQILEMDPENKQKVKMYGDALGKLMNEIKAFEQRQQEAAKAAQEQSQIDPEAAAKARVTEMLAKHKMEITDATTQQKLAHKEQAAQQKAVQFQTSMEQLIERHRAEMAKLVAETQTQLAIDEEKAISEIENARKKANSASEQPVGKN